MKKILLLTLTAFCLASVSCGDDDDSPQQSPYSFNTEDDKEKGKDNTTTDPSQDPNSDPNPDPGQQGSDDTKYLKDYIDRTAHPIFKFSGAIEAWDFNSKAWLRDTLANHFDEIVAGNSMKYSGCVDGNGNMNFNTVKQFCENAKAAGLTIYGHTLAWHSQQQPKYLNSLIADKEVDVEEEEMVEITDFTLASYTTVDGLWHGDFTNAENNVDYSMDVADGLLHIKNNAVSAQSWQVQYHIAENLNLKAGTKYVMTIKTKASEAASLPYSIGSWYPENVSGNLEVTTEMKEYKVEFTAVVDGGFIMFQTGAFVGDIWVESIKITHQGSNKIQALTSEEKRAALAGAMEKWIKGIMDATDGFVTGWDVVNEAISGGGNDGEGNYTLQHNNSHNTDPTSVQNGLFFWQDDMGDLEYVRYAVAFARKYFKGDPKDLKLFINDYNLESDWDDNKKLKSLINWIKKWESDGETYIDGIGTQMHISCYEDDGINESKKKHIRQMFQLMAATGKLVRVSELDMGYVRKGSNRGIATADVKPEEHKKMADLYKFVIESYFELVPPEQQYGICQWCLTDAGGQLGTGWRGGEPVGIWTEGYKQRKEAYRGFAEGLSVK